jgi:hypothetical protein
LVSRATPFGTNPSARKATARGVAIARLEDSAGHLRSHKLPGFVAKPTHVSLHNALGFSCKRTTTPRRKSMPNLLRRLSTADLCCAARGSTSLQAPTAALFPAFQAFLVDSAQQETVPRDHHLPVAFAIATAHQVTTIGERRGHGKPGPPHHDVKPQLSWRRKQARDSFPVIDSDHDARGFR